MNELTGCPICESDKIAYTYTGKTTRNPKDLKEWKIFGCSQCDHRFLNPQPDWDDLSDYYNASYPAYDATHGIGQDFASEIATARGSGEYRHVKIHDGMSILDVGCGGGSFLQVAKGLGARVKAWNRHRSHRNDAGSRASTSSPARSNTSWKRTAPKRNSTSSRSAMS